MESADAFIAANWQGSLPEIALQLSKNTSLPKDFILRQINGLQKSQRKLPTWFNTKGIFFPPALSLEQCSSELTAEFKANIVKGNSMADLTGGMGVDSWAFAQHFESVHYVEHQEAVAQHSQHNFHALGAKNIQVHQNDATNFLTLHQATYDLIYLDPDRRPDRQKKGVLIEDCAPDLSVFQKKVAKHAKTWMIKYSPMLDIQQALRSLSHIKTVYVVAVNNECKELLFIGERNYTAPHTLITVNYQTNRWQRFEGSSLEKVKHYADPLSYLYEPNAAIMKAGLFAAIGNRFGLSKLAPDSHLYTADEWVPEFPGRIFKLNRMAAPKKGLLQKANVITRNFPMKAEILQKKYSIKDGGDQYLLATSLQNKKKVFLICERLQ